VYGSGVADPFKIFDFLTAYCETANDEFHLKIVAAPLLRIRIQSVLLYHILTK
jgi:hypothetical protein